MEIYVRLCGDWLCESIYIMPFLDLHPTSKHIILHLTVGHLTTVGFRRILSLVVTKEFVGTIFYIIYIVRFL